MPTTNEPRAVPRAFLYGATRLPDPDSALSPEAVLAYYAGLGVYPDLVNATVGGVDFDGDAQVYVFERAARTKGGDEPDQDPPLTRDDQVRLAAKIDRCLSHGVVDIEVDELAHLGGLLVADIERALEVDTLPELRWAELASRGALDVQAEPGMAAASWAPGDGYLYRFSVVLLGQHARIFGAAERAWLFTLYHESGPHLSWPFGAGPIAHLRYVDEKLGLDSPREALIVTALLNLLLPGYDARYGAEVFDNFKASLL